MSEQRKPGAKLSGLLESRTQPEPVEPTDGLEPAEDAKGRGVGAKKGQGPARPAKKAPGRTLYIDDALWERIIVQAHRRKRTISDYVSGVLDKSIPDHRTLRSDTDAA